MSNIKILLDMDGVLCDYSTHFVSITNANNKNICEYQKNKAKLIGTSFYSDIPKFDTTDQIIEFVCEHFGGYDICSTPMIEDWDNSIKHKLLWISNNLHIQPTNIYFTENKGNHAKLNSILIDDYSKNIKDFISNGGMAIDFKNGIDSIWPMFDKLLAIKSANIYIEREQ